MITFVCMLDDFKENIQDESLFTPADSVLLTVSSGVDSSVMAELFYRAGFSFAIAHCNFGLRGKESDGDEKFVKERAMFYGVPFFTKRFDTRRYAKEKGISIQMAARELRYRWFEEIRVAGDFHFVATAHHKDDVAETFLLNLIRGTGIAGMHGILPARGRIIRPLLFASKKEIDTYARKNQIPWRKDSSNDEEKYLRNKIRQKVIPALRELNLSVTDSLINTARYLRDAEVICRQYIEKRKGELVLEKDGVVRIPVAALGEMVPLNTWMFEFLRNYGFSAVVADDVASSLQGQPGRQFFSPTHRLVRDREHLFVIPNDRVKKRDEKIIIHPETDRIFHPFNLCFSRRTFRKNVSLPSEPNIACLDFKKLTFPLILRRWKPGDAFRPLGMKGTKKLSDFLIERKVPRHKKEDTWVVLNGSEIVWVVGQRIDERYKVISETKELYVITVVRQN